MSSVTFARRAAECVRRLAVCCRHDFVLVLELAWWRICLPVMKRVVSVAALTRLMWSDGHDPRDSSDRARRLLETRDIIGRGGRVLVSSNCLERSLVLYRLFSRAGANPRLVLGTAVEKSAVLGHAWVELNGVPVGESERDRYTSLIAFGPHGRFEAYSDLPATT
jgi:hypothetical protein